MKTQTPAVSVLMPAYNAEKYITQAIESVLNQSFKDFEFIILDDASTDNTWKIIEKFARSDNRIKPLQNKKNLYIAGARNILVKQCKGKYIVWADADDISLPYRIQKQYDFMEEHTEVGIVGGFLQFFDDGGNKGIRKYPESDDAIRKNIFRYAPVAQPAAMVRKECLNIVGEYNLKYPPSEDLDMNFRIGTKYKFANIQKVLIYYRQNNSSATYSKLKKMELDTIEIRRKYANGFGYKMTLIDKLYNLLQYITLFIMPPLLRITIFNLFRNSK